MKEHYVISEDTYLKLLTKLLRNKLITVREIDPTACYYTTYSHYPLEFGLKIWTGYSLVKEYETSGKVPWARLI